MAAATAVTGMRTAWAWAIGSFFGIGLVGKGGGTIASALTVGLWWLAAQSTGSLVLPFATAAAALAVTLVGVYVAGIMAREAGIKDPSAVVADEVAGQLIALIAAPVDWKYALAGLILFRAFDIVKPPPVRNLEALPGGWGIMMDDVAAGIYTLFLVQMLLRLQLF